MYTDFTRILVSFTFYPEDLLRHRLRDSGHGDKSLLYSHRCGQVFLDGSYVIANFQQVSGKGVTEGVETGIFVYADL